MDNEWFRDFFDGVAVDFWTAAAPPAGDDIDFLKAVFGPPDGREVLDLACGAGRHAIPLSRAGYGMTAVDLSPAFLAMARKTAETAGVAVDWQRRDMRDLPWRGRFHGAICMGNSFGYIGRAGTKDCVAAVASALESGGSFVLDTGATAESLLPALQQRRWMEVADILFLSSASYDIAGSRLDVEYTFIRGDQREKKTASTSVFTVAELREMFETSGFVIEGTYSSLERDPFRLGSPRLILVARKR
ncbi:MAG TPA: class I SAM-dependent methyltransferase [Thermoanaerobaculia bacterium]|nr:class I SAM-dependent methyltransferase [Thermoanaerobaculia bacterium]